MMMMMMMIIMTIELMMVENKDHDSGKANLF
jgi:hypothetical protein